jgi:hypothetical protein
MVFSVNQLSYAHKNSPLMKGSFFESIPALSGISKQTAQTAGPEFPDDGGRQQLF